MKKLVYLLALVFHFTYAAEPLVPAQKSAYPSLETAQADWIFSGIVNNESGESYHYYFELQKNNDHYQAIASLTERETRHLVLYEKSEAVLPVSNATQWQIGSLFLNFNPITNSWLFGVQKQHNKGFQFKVDMLSQSTNPKSVQTRDLGPGLKFSVSQAGLLHGYLQTGTDEKDYFVTAAKSFFQQVWATETLSIAHNLTGVLCEFNNGNSFYAINLKEADALQDAIAGWQNEAGNASPVSQFVSIASAREKTWTLDLASPKLHLNIQDLTPDTENKPLVIGVSEGLPGFCSIRKNVFIG